MSIITKIFGTSSERAVKKMNPIIDSIEALDSKFSQMSEKELKEEISRRIDELSYASTERNMSVISAIKDDINELLEDKNTDDEEIMSVADRLEQLRYEKAQIEKDYSGEKLEITAPEHGVFSTKIDGFEDKITPELALNITVSDYKNAKDKKLTGL